MTLNVTTVTINMMVKREDPLIKTSFRENSRLEHRRNEKNAITQHDLKNSDSIAERLLKFVKTVNNNSFLDAFESLEIS